MAITTRVRRLQAASDMALVMLAVGEASEAFGDGCMWSGGLPRPLVIRMRYAHQLPVCPLVETVNSEGLEGPAHLFTIAPATYFLPSAPFRTIYVRDHVVPSPLITSLPRVGTFKASNVFQAFTCSSNLQKLFKLEEKDTLEFSKASKLGQLLCNRWKITGPSTVPRGSKAENYVPNYTEKRRLTSHDPKYTYPGMHLEFHRLGLVSFSLYPNIPPLVLQQGVDKRPELLNVRLQAGLFPILDILGVVRPLRVL